MLNIYSKDLELGFNVDTRFVDFTKKTHDLSLWMQDNMPFRFWDQNLVSFLSQFDAEILHGEIFYTPPFKPPGGIHLDCDFNFPGPSNRAKLNWILDDGVGPMCWWKLKPDCQYRPRISTAKTLSFNANLSDCEMVYLTPIGKPSLVNSGILHSVDNSKSSVGRWCISYVIKSKSSKQPFEWLDAVEVLKDYITN